MIRTRRVYDHQGTGEGYRVLIDRLWPRGISRERASWDEWMKEAGPGNELRKWFSHDPEKWDEFRRRYRLELDRQPEVLTRLRELQKEHGTLTLLYASREERYNNAVALLEFLTESDR